MLSKNLKVERAFKLGHELVSKKNTILYIANQDGSPRWLWSIKNKKPDFLVFYNASTLKQKLIVLGIKIIFLLRIQKFVFPIYSGPLVDEFDSNNDVLFTGTKGPNNKLIIYNNSQQVFVKKARGSSSKIALENEVNTLNILKENNSQFSFEFPELLQHGESFLKISSLLKSKQELGFNEKHISCLTELASLHSSRSSLKDWEVWKEVETRLKNLRNSTKIGFEVNYLLHKLFNGIDPSIEVNYAFSHGDFTPWNMFFDDHDALQVIDWEMSKDERTIGYDFFHFFVQKGILVERYSWKDIYCEIQQQYKLHRASTLGLTQNNIDHYLSLYLLDHISYYSELYEDQKDWFDQIHWQIATWKDALLWANHRISTREELISYLFSKMKNHDYGVLKIGDEDPTKISEWSDIDILIKKENCSSIINDLKSLPSIEKIEITKQSFMAQLKIQLFNGETLFLDLIWKLKRKSKVFQNTSEMIDRSQVNRYGVKAISKMDNARYIHSFFTQNGATIPSKYKNIVDEFKSLEDLEEMTYVQKENSGWKGVLNRSSYLMDVIKRSLFNRGFIVTFSGVDGAGKSTIIENVKTRIEKSFRKPVKVLRHRPSLFPILSSYAYGKKEAEKRSMERLPRQGTNKNYLSSLLRFLYYYTDYFFGQFVIYFKYVLRGYVVIYDRYYYDFISDPKRSNIQLGKLLPKFGFRFLIVPRYNFFLYADPEVILKRKQELSRIAIENLTGAYTSLFKEYNKKRKAFFISIENVHLDRTITRILSHLKKG